MAVITATAVDKSYSRKLNGCDFTKMPKTPNSIRHASEDHEVDGQPTN